MGTTPTDVSAREIVTVLRSHGSEIIDRTGSHVKLRRVDPNTGDVRDVTVPQYDRIDIDLLQKITTQSGANHFHKWCRWIDECR